MCERKALGTISERHRSLSWRVERREDVDEKSNQAKMGRIALWNQKAQSGGKQRPCHLRKREEKQAPATERVDCPNGRPSKDKVDEAEPKRRNECLSLSGVCLSEDRTGVESDDVDCF
jgi:hypothetical protein